MTELSEENQGVMELHTMLRGAVDLGLGEEVLRLAGPMTLERARLTMLKIGVISAFEAKKAERESGRR